MEGLNKRKKPRVAVSGRLSAAFDLVEDMYAMHVGLVLDKGSWCNLIRKGGVMQ